MSETGGSEKRVHCERPCVKAFQSNATNQLKPNEQHSVHFFMLNKTQSTLRIHDLHSAYTHTQHLLRPL